MAKLAGWVYKPSQAGWGEYESMLRGMEQALRGRDFLLGKQFSMADMIFGGTLRYMLRFKMVEPMAAFTGYAERLGARPALHRADARNAQIAAEHGLQPG